MRKVHIPSDVRNSIPESTWMPAHLEIPDRVSGFGGQAFIYFSGEYAVKIYKDRYIRKDSIERLKKLVRLGNKITPDNNQVLAWPLGVVDQINGQPCVGVVTRRVPCPPHIDLLKLIYSPIEACESFKNGVRWINFIKIARCTARAVQSIHDQAIWPSDISLNNVLANPLTGLSVLIDLDSSIVPGFVRPEVRGGTQGFSAPEIVAGEANPSERSDRHSLAVLLMWILLFRNVMQPTKTACYSIDQVEDERLGWGKMACFSENPRKRAHWFPAIGKPMYNKGALSYTILTPKLQELVNKAFIEYLHEPWKRPSARDWEHALAETYDVYVVCGECKQTFLYPYWNPNRQLRVCPFCGKFVRPPYPAVLELLERDNRGKMIPQAVRTLVLQNGSMLYEDQIQLGRLPPLTRNTTPVLGRTWLPEGQSVLRLANQSKGSWQVFEGGSGIVNPGQAITLMRGMTISFGSGRRLARVIE